MRKSQSALLSAGMIVVVAAVAIVVAARIAAGRLGGPDAGLEWQPAGAEAIARKGERVDLSGFDRLTIDGEWEVTVRQGSEWSVVLEVPERLRERMRVRVDDGALVLAYDVPAGQWWRRISRDTPEPAAAVVMPALTGVELVGTTSMQLAGFEGETLEIEASGATRLIGRDGRYRELALRLTGAAAADLAGVVADRARIQLSGASAVTLGLDDGGSLSGTAAGAALVRYYGALAEQTVTVNGFGRVLPVP